MDPLFRNENAAEKPFDVKSEVQHYEASNSMYEVLIKEELLHELVRNSSALFLRESLTS